MVSKQKILERRLRRAAARRGLQLVKSRRRDPHAIGYGEFMLVNADTNAAVAGLIDSHQSMSLEEVDAWFSVPPGKGVGN